MNYKLEPIRLREARNLKKLTLREVSERTGLSRQHISNMESGINKVEASVFYTLAKIYNQDPSFFLATD